MQAESTNLVLTDRMKYKFLPALGGARALRVAYTVHCRRGPVSTAVFEVVAGSTN